MADSEDASFLEGVRWSPEDKLVAVLYSQGSQWSLWVLCDSCGSGID